MKIKDTFILSEIGDSYIVVSTGEETVNLNGMITLNETGAFFFSKMQEEITKEELAQLVVSEYDVDIETVNNDIDNFVEKLRKIGALCE